MDGKDSTVWILLLTLAMRTEPSRDPRCSRTGTISRGVHDRSAGRLASVPQPRRWTRRTVSQLASARRQLDQKDRKTEFGISVDGRCIDTEVFQPRYLVHELVFACIQTARPRVSHTILTQADWCLIRAVARSELGLLPVIQSGFRVFWHEVEIRTQCSACGVLEFRTDMRT